MHQMKRTVFLMLCVLITSCATERAARDEAPKASTTYAALYNRPAVIVRKWVTPNTVDGMITVNGDWQQANFHAEQESEEILTKFKGQIDGFDWIKPRERKDGVFISTSHHGPTAVVQYSSLGEERVQFSNEGNNLRLVAFEDGSYAFNNVIKFKRLVSVYLGNVLSGSPPSVLIESDNPDVEYRVEAGSRRFGKLFIYRRVADDQQSSIMIYDVAKRTLDRTYMLGIGEQLSSISVSAESDRWCMVKVKHGAERMLLCQTLGGEMIGTRNLESGKPVRISISNNGQWIAILQRTKPAVASVHHIDAQMEASHTFTFDENQSIERAIVNDRGDKLAYSGGSFSSISSAGVVDLGTGISRCLGCTLLSTKDVTAPLYSSYTVKPSRSENVGDRKINVHIYEPATSAAKGSIIFLHGGPQGHISKSYNIGFFYQSMVRGYRIVAPNVRGSTDQDAAFEAADNGFARVDVLQDIKDVIEDTAKRYVGPIFLVGESFAGNYVFATAISVSSITATACLSCVYSRDAFLYDTPEAIQEVGDSRLPDVQRFWDSFEPMALAPSLKTPTLVVGGELDRRTPVQHMQEFVSIVREHGGRIEAVLLPKGVHNLGDIASGELEQSSVANFFDRFFEIGTQ